MGTGSSCPFDAAVCHWMLVVPDIRLNAEPDVSREGPPTCRRPCTEECWVQVCQSYRRRLPGLLLGSGVVFRDVRQQAPNPFGGNPRGAAAFLNRDQKSCAVGNVVQVETHAAPDRLEDPVDMGFNIPRQPTVQTTGIQGAPEAQQYPPPSRCAPATRPTTAPPSPCTR